MNKFFAYMVVNEPVGFMALVVLAVICVSALVLWHENSRLRRISVKADDKKS